MENPDTFKEKKVESKWMAEYRKALIISVICFAVCLGILLCVRHFRRDRSHIVDDFC